MEYARNKKSTMQRDQMQNDLSWFLRENQFLKVWNRHKGLDGAGCVLGVLNKQITIVWNSLQHTMLMTKTLVGLQNYRVLGEGHCVTTWSSHPCSFWLEECVATEHQKLQDGTGGKHGLCLCRSSKRAVLAIQIVSIRAKRVLWSVVPVTCITYVFCV